MAPDRHGPKWMRARNKYKTWCQARNLPCIHCRQPINYTAPKNHPDSFELDHRHPISTHPHLIYDEGNWLPSHSKCNRQRGNQPIQTGRWVEADW